MRNIIVFALMLTMLASCNRPRRHVSSEFTDTLSVNSVTNEARCYDYFTKILDSCKGYGVVVAVGTSKTFERGSTNVIYHLIIKDSTNTFYRYHGPFLKGFMENEKSELIAKGDTLIVK